MNTAFVPLCTAWDRLNKFRYQVAGFASLPKIMGPMINSSDRKSNVWSVARVASGNFLEMYDFMVFGYYAAAIGNAFFRTIVHSVP